jgi:hypothetical protein
MFTVSERRPAKVGELSSDIVESPLFRLPVFFQSLQLTYPLPRSVKETGAATVTVYDVSGGLTARYSNLYNGTITETVIRFHGPVGIPKYDNAVAVGFLAADLQRHSGTSPLPRRGGLGGRI